MPSLPQTRDWIYANRSLFRNENEFNESELFDFFNIDIPDFSNMSIADIRKAANSMQLKKVAAQTKINRVLSTRGLYMSQFDNNMYRVRARNTVQRKIAELNRQGQAKIGLAERTSAGVARFNSRLSRRVANYEL